MKEFFINNESKIKLIGYVCVIALTLYIAIAQTTSAIYLAVWLMVFGGVIALLNGIKSFNVKKLFNS